MFILIYIPINVILKKIFTVPIFNEFRSRKVNPFHLLVWKKEQGLTMVLQRFLYGIRTRTCMRENLFWILINPFTLDKIWVCKCVPAMKMLLTVLHGSCVYCIAGDWVLRVYKLKYSNPRDNKLPFYMRNFG